MASVNLQVLSRNKEVVVNIFIHHKYHMCCSFCSPFFHCLYDYKREHMILNANARLETQNHKFDLSDS